ncbi:MAG: flagellar protein FlgN [Burkholderiales bacterium]|nr:flagellar protein FlgN [Burkholderiales bacterium]
MSTTAPFPVGHDRPGELGAIDELRACLLREYMELQDFVDFLERELKDIAGFDAEKLIGNTTAKEQRLARLAAIDRQRDMLLARMGIPATANGMATLLRDEPEFAQTMRKVWDGIVATGTRAQQLNETNGRLIASQLAYYESRMSALVRLARPDSTYGADGRPQTHGWTLANTRA